MEDQVSEEAVARKPGLTCPKCQYAGDGFKYVEFVPTVSEIVAGTFTVLIDRAEPRYDEIDLDSDRIECPACHHQFAVPEDFVEGGNTEFNFAYRFPARVAA